MNGGCGARRHRRPIRDEYRAYFLNATMPASAASEDARPGMPRAFYVPGVGIFAAGPTRKQSVVAADVIEATIDVIPKAEGIDSFEALSEADLFDIEYWSLEQASWPPADRKTADPAGHHRHRRRWRTSTVASRALKAEERGTGAVRRRTRC